MASIYTYMIKKRHMLNLLIGGIVGIVISAIVQSYTNGSESGNIQTITNIVIAMATVAAVLITQEQARFQKGSRLWEANKKPLLDLSKTISDTLQATELLAEVEFEKMNGISASRPSLNPDTKIFGRLKEKLRHVIEAYEPILDEKLLNEIKIHLQSENEIDRQVTEDEINVFEAYDKLGSLLRNLLKTVNSQIKTFATT